ncbi:MAG: hypothetical protein L3J69_09765, partial [Desulfobacula sp.]|nr:hypothetical protein [Desulfobacula sp.]
NKINGIEPQTSAELVRYAAREISPIIEGLGGTKESPLPGFRVRCKCHNHCRCLSRSVDN